MTTNNWGQIVTLLKSFILKDNKITVPVFIDMEWLYDAAFDHVGSSEVCIFGYGL